jgi:hypothetical protein
MPYAYYETATGRLVSVGTDANPSPPAGVTELQIASLPNLATQTWDAATRTFVARPAKVLIDRLDEILTHPDYGADIQALWATLNTTNRTRLRNGLIRLLGRYRFRSQGETLNLP